MCFSIQRLTCPGLSFDIDHDNRSEDIEILQTNFYYPLLARWEKDCPGKRGGKRKVWAVASHFVVRGAPADLAKAERKVLKLLGPEALDFRSLSERGKTANGDDRQSSFRVGLPRSSPRFQRLCHTSPGKVVDTIRSLREALQPELASLTVEPDYVYFAAAEPGDPDYTVHQRPTMERIGAQLAWDRHKGSKRVKVAIIDTGIDLSHPDLSPNLLRDPNGRIVGWNVLDPTRPPEDDHWHGTYCAGLVGAQGNNDIGMAGVNWKVSLIPIKAFNSAGMGTATHAAAAIRYAVEQEADVILCAWGNDGDSKELKSALIEAGDNKILVVAAAGNSGLTLEESPHFPASFGRDLPNVISVAATDQQDKPLPGSAASAETVHLSAPGDRVYSTFPTRLQPFLPYHVARGTSPAAALVAGGCALLKAYAQENYPDKKHLDIRQAVLTGDFFPQLQEVSTTGMRINLDKAMRALGNGGNGGPPPAGGNGGQPSRSGSSDGGSGTAAAAQPAKAGSPSPAASVAGAASGYRKQPGPAKGKSTKKAAKKTAGRKRSAAGSMSISK